MTIVIVTLHEDPSRSTIILLKSFFFTLVLQTFFVKKLKTYLLFSPYYNTLLHVKYGLCVAVSRREEYGQTLMVCNTYCFIFR